MKLRMLLLLVVLFVPVCARSASPTGSVAGRVVDETGRPVAGVVVETLTPPSRGTYQAKTDQSGKYTLNDLPAKSYDLILAKNDVFLSVALKNISVQQGQVTQAPDLVAIKGARLSGRVVDKDSGEAIRGAYVGAGGDNLLYVSTEVDSNGAYNVLVAPGKVTVKCITASKYYPCDPSTMITVTVPPEGLTGADFKLKKAEVDAARGTVVDENGQPAKNAVLDFMGQPFCTGHAFAKDGTYEMLLDRQKDSKPCTGTLTVANATHAKVEAINREELLKGHDIVVEPYQTFKIYVKTSNGVPLSGAKITRAMMIRGMNPGEYKVSDANGEIVVSKLMAGSIIGYDVTLSGYYCANQPEKLPEVGSPDWKDTITITMTRADRVQTGKVVNKSGKPVAGVRVSTLFGPEAMTDEKGEFVLNNMPDDTVEIEASEVISRNMTAGTTSGVVTEMKGKASVNKDTGPVTIVLGSMSTALIN